MDDTPPLTKEQRAALRHPEKAHRPDNPIQRKPDWIRVKAPTSAEYHETRRLMRELKLATVCEEAACPNIGECWKKKHATVMILGSVCTRACAFCNVATGKPDKLDPHEPENTAKAVAGLGMTHIVITSVDRDDLEDGGAMQFVRTIEEIRARSPGTTIEILTPDFLRKDGALEKVAAARPDVFNHNLETVPRLYPTIRPGARYFHSLRLLQRVKEVDPSIFTKSGIMVGLGEDRIEVGQVMDDLRIHPGIERSAGNDFLKKIARNATGTREGKQQTTRPQQFEAQQIDILVSTGGLFRMRRGGGKLRRIKHDQIKASRLIPHLA